MKQLKILLFIILLFTVNSYGNEVNTQEIDNTSIESFSRIIGTQEEESSNGLVIDSNGNFYLCGTSEGNLTAQSETKHKNFFIQKLSSSGRVIWIKQYSQIEVNIQTEAVGLSIDTDNNIYLGGNFVDYADLNNVETGIFATKYSSDGELIWFKKTVDNAASLGSIKVSNDSKLYLAGDKSYWEYISGSMEHNTSMFIAQYSLDGDKLLEKEFENIQLNGSTHEIYDIEFDAQNNIYLAGKYISKPFDYPNGDSDLYLTKFSSSLNQEWSKILGAEDEIDEDNNIPSSEEIVSIKIVDGYIYAVGTTLGNFDSQHSVKEMSLYSRYGIFLKFDLFGTEMIRKQFSLNNDNTIPLKLLVDENGLISSMVLNGEMNIYSEFSNNLYRNISLHKLTFNDSADIVKDTILISDSDDIYYLHNLDADYTADGTLVTTSVKNKGGHFVIAAPPRDERDLDVELRIYRAYHPLVPISIVLYLL